MQRTDENGQGKANHLVRKSFHLQHLEGANEQGSEGAKGPEGSKDDFT